MEARYVKEIYAWVPWFKELAQIVADGGKDSLVERAKEVQWTSDGQDPPLLKHGDENVDPFSFFYYLAGRSDTAENRRRIYPSIDEFFGTPNLECLDRDEAFYIPQSIRSWSFHQSGEGNPGLLWDLFRSAVQGVESISASDFDKSLEIPRVGVSKLTHVLFLVNPDEFLPLDERVLSLGIAESRKLDEIQWDRYREELRRIRNAFPGCRPYEIDLLAYLRSEQKREIVVSRRVFQVSSRVDGNENKDHWEDFEENNWVYTSGPSTRVDWGDPESNDAGFEYPLREARPGDVVTMDLSGTIENLRERVQNWQRECMPCDVKVVTGSALHDAGWSTQAASGQGSTTNVADAVQNRAREAHRPRGLSTRVEADLLRLGRVPAVPRGARAGRAGEQARAVRERHVTAVGAKRTVDGLVALDEHLDAGGDRVAAPAAAHQGSRRAGLDHPGVDRAVLVGHVDVQPGVRVDPLHLGDRAPQRDRLGRVELGRERMVRKRRAARHQDGERDARQGQCQSVPHR